MKKNPHLSQKKINLLKEMLLDMKRQITGRVRMNPGIQNTEYNDRIDGIDQKTFTPHNECLTRRDKLYWTRIRSSLEKIKTGGYGICRECESSIHFSRLKSRPTSDLCDLCKEDKENEEQRNYFNHDLFNDLHPIGHSPNSFHPFDNFPVLIGNDLKIFISTVGNLIKSFWKKLKF